MADETYDVPGLMEMSQEELDELFSSRLPGPIPDGEGKGTAIVAPGVLFTPEIAAFINVFAWQGKIFDAKAGLLRNRILVLGFDAIVARIYVDKSWLDGKDCIVLDYADTSIIAQWVRDEMRMIQPGLYLGKVFWDGERLIDFALEFPTAP